MNYQTYLQSEHWKQVKNKYKRSTKKRRRDKRVVCKICSCFGPVDVHHLTYARVGAERVNDLLGLCRSCHQMVHDVQTVTADSKARLPRSIRAARKQWWRHANHNRLWKLRYTDPGHFSQLASVFLYQQLGKSERLNSLATQRYR